MLKDLEAAETSWPPRDFADNQDSYRDAIVSMFAGPPDDTKKDLQKLLTPDFYIRSGTDTFDFAQFVTHARGMRASKSRLAVTSVMFLRDGNKLAAHLISHVQGQSGRTYRRETLQFAEVHGDGRLARIVEMAGADERCPSPDGEAQGGKPAHRVA